MEPELKLSGWALILGSSSGFGEAIALELARRGMDIFGVHFDRRATLPEAERIVAEIRALGRNVHFFNVNAADPEQRKTVLDVVAAETQGKPAVRTLVHSLAFGTLRPYICEPAAEGLSAAQMNMTLDVMGHSLVYWTQDLVARNLIGDRGRIFAMTSAGGHRVWPAYGAVSAAKAALESHIRQLAFELAPRGITANAICAGVTDTPALRKIPGADVLIAGARQKNPSLRLTETKDVARTIAALSHPATAWLTGNVINVDGGEDLSG